MMIANLGNLSRDEMERRRLAAAEELLGGLSQSKVARKYGVSRTTASRWQKALCRQGVESLRKRRATGRPPRLTAEQFATVIQIFGEGAKAHGFYDDRWTTLKLAKAIHAKFGVMYDRDHVGRLMHRLGLRKRRMPELKQAA